MKYKTSGVCSRSIDFDVVDNKVTNVSTLRYYLYEHKTGDTIKVTYIRDGKESILDMKLIEK